MSVMNSNEMVIFLDVMGHYFIEEGMEQEYVTPVSSYMWNLESGVI